MTDAQRWDNPKQILAELKKTFKNQIQNKDHRGAAQTQKKIKNLKLIKNM